MTQQHQPQHSFRQMSTITRLYIRCSCNWTPPLRPWFRTEKVRDEQFAQHLQDVAKAQVSI